MPKQSRRAWVSTVASNLTASAKGGMSEIRLKLAIPDSNWPSLPAQNDNQRVTGQIGTPQVSTTDE